MSKAQHHQVTASDGLRLHAVTYGDESATPVVLVHGYPDNHLVWEPVAERLAERYYVVAYDVRGAGRSESGRRIRDYRLDQLGQDLAAVVDALIPGRGFHLAAHDWGSIQSWESVTTSRLQGRILSYTTISGPCLDHAAHWMRRRLLTTQPGLLRQGLGQLASSWYIVMFQLPLLAPTLWQTVLGRLWPAYLEHREGVKESTPSPTQTADGKEGVQLYRANFVPKMIKPEQRHAHCPVQLLVPTGDNYVNVGLFDDLTQWVPELYRRDIDATHWVPLSQPDLIAGWIDEFARHIDGTETSAAVDAARVA
ncbi:alpha/beta fold hydrolase [Amnimonas aquatica]|uniref:Alpha/beta hydrolase n=1 Tax=Amnimonas aquatica TaxID=2094561 RepID=A0A2P6AU93_9GAMM|nr:alpha/beta fold hydrolase [Amnimonas aquatica]PQA49411.1 alpha/beta hydrolase [Amnimonas aquatica]